MTALAYLFTVLKNIIYGSTKFFTTGLDANGVDVLDILALRFLLSFSVLWLLKVTKIIKINVGIKDIFKSTEKHPYIKSLFLAALFEPVLYMLFETLGFTMTTDVTAGVILSLMPISVCVCESFILKEKTTWLQKIFLGLGIIGVIYIGINTSSSDGKDTPLGILFIILAVASGSLFLVLSRKSSKHFAAFEVTYFASLLGAVVFNAVNVIRHLWKGDILDYFKPYFNVDNLIGFVFLAVVSTIMATSMNNFALSRIQASTSSACSGVSTLVTILIGVFISGEKLYTFHYIGFALILIRMIGVSYIAIKKDKKSVH